MYQLISIKIDTIVKIESDFNNYRSFFQNIVKSGNNDFFI